RFSRDWSSDVCSSDLVAGATLLGPIGLLGGALVGWKLSTVIAGQRNLANARSAVVSRLDEIAAELLRDVDKQVASAVDSVRAAETGRPSCRPRRIRPA